MNDVFISYSRRDGVFARRLVERLAEQGLDSWVDWTGIPYSTEWWAEIRKGIDSAQNFVFLITPDSVTSRVCNLEVEYARQTNKRIIPLMRREPDVRALGDIWANTDWVDTARSNYQHLTQINWIFFRKRTDPEFDCQHDERTLETLNPDCDSADSDFDDFESSVTALLNVIRQDVHHVDQHTRLNVRARDWQAHRHGLLRGQELIDAEAWLAAGEDKSPAPTALHREFIQTSRSAANRERRRVITGLSAGLVVAVALAILSLIGFSNAETQRERADANASTSVANADLAGTQAFRADANAATSDANAIFAQTQAFRADSNAATSDANEIIAQTQAMRADNNAATSDANVTLAVEAQATAVRRADEFGSLALAANARLIRESNPNVALALAVEANQVAEPPALALRTLADIAYAPGLIRTMQENFAPVDSVSLDSTGRYAVAANWDGELLVFDALTGEQIFRRAGHFVGVMHPDGQRLIATDPVGSLYVWDIATGEALQVKRLDSREIDESFAVGDQNRVAIHPDGTVAAIGSLDGVINLWDLDSGDLLETFNKPSDNTHSIKRLAFRNVGNLLLAIDASGVIQAINVPERDIILEASTPRTDVIAAADFHPNGGEVAIYSVDAGEIVIVDVSGGEELGALPRLHDEHILTLNYDSTGDLLLSGSYDSTVILRDANTNTLINRFRGHLTDVLSAAWSADGRMFVSGGYDGRVLLWDTQPGNLISAFVDANGGGLSERFSPRGDLLATLGETAVILRSAETGEALRELHIDARPTAIDFNADGTRLLVGSDRGRISLWDTQDGTRLFDMPAQNELISDVRFIGGGDRALIASYDGGIRLIDADAGLPLRRYDLHSAEVSSIAVSPDGQTAASSSEMTVLVWNIADGTVLHTFEAHQHNVNDLVFLDARRLASSSPDELFVWDVETGDLLRDLNAMLTARTLPNLNVRSSLRIGPGGISVMTLSPDARLLASSRCGLFNDERCVEAEISLWDAATLDLITSFGGGGMEIESLAIHPDRTRLAAGSWHGETRVWNLDVTLAELLSWTEANRIPADLTCAEREAYDVAIHCASGTPAPTSTLHPTLTVTPTVDLVAVTATPTLPPTLIATLVPTATLTPTPDPAADIRALDLPFTVTIPDFIPGHEVESWRYIDDPDDVFGTSRDLFSPGNEAVSLRVNRGGVYAGFIVQSVSPYADLDEWFDTMGFDRDVFTIEDLQGVEIAMIVDPDLAIAVFIRDGVFFSMSFTIQTEESIVLDVARVFAAA